jgi:hypothetical protein
MGYPMKAISVLSVAATLIVGLSACGTYGVASSKEQRDAGITELEKRGFEDPTFVTDQYGNTDEMRFNAKVDNCRVLISIRETGALDYVDASWSDEQFKKVRSMSGGSMSSIVNASFIRTYGNELGWAHCLKK